MPTRIFRDRHRTLRRLESVGAAAGLCYRFSAKRRGAESRPGAHPGRAGQRPQGLPQHLPLWGRKAIEKGFDLPKPLGLNVIGLYMNQGIEITDLGLSTGANPIAPIDFIGFGTNTSTVYSSNLRLDLWMLPFLNVYGFGGRAQANTTVRSVHSDFLHE